MKPLQLALADFRHSLMIQRLVQLDRDHQPVDPRRAFPGDLEQIVPLDRIGDVVAVGVAGLREIVGRADDHETFTVGEPFELDTDALAHGAARPVGTDQVATRDPLALAVGRTNLDLHRVR